MNPDVLRYPESIIADAVGIIPTPFFLYEESRIREKCKILKSAFGKHFENFSPLFAVKANPNPHILKIIQEEGFGMDCSSDSEVWLTNRLKIWGMHTGSYTSSEELKMVLESKSILLNLDDISLLKKVENIRIPEFLSFRVNVGFSKGDSENNTFAGKEAKFGIRLEDALKAYKEAKDLGVKRFGIHAMTGSNVLDEEYFALVAEELWDVMIQIYTEFGIEFEYMNIGGGFGMPYHPEEATLDMEKIAKKVRLVFDEKRKETTMKEPKLMVEPGRWITADAGFLVTKILSVKDGYKRFLGVDASANNMPRPAIYGAYHHISVLGKGFKKSTEKVNVVGRLCENSDQFARDRELPNAQEGEYIVIHNCGAHAFSMGHNYNGRTRCAEYLLKEDGDIVKIRESETIADLFAKVTPFE